MSGNKAYSIGLERELGKMLFTERPVQKRTERNPITQSGILDKESENPSDSRPRGPARGEFSQQGQESFKFDFMKDTQPWSPSVKKSECTPVNRNPITQDHPSLAPVFYTQGREKYSKVRDSTVFSESSEQVLVKTRSNQ